MVGARNRECSKRKALRKQKIAKMIYGAILPGWEYYDNLHQYSKNKIHCSCPLCRVKTGDPGVGYKISDLRKIDRVSFVELESENETLD